MASNLKFEASNTQEQIKAVFNFNTEAFTDTQDFTWTKENIEEQINSGWDLVSVKSGKEIVCALFIKKDKKALLTKNTPIKINHQGNGYSHLIKEYYENYAKDNGLGEVYNYCPADNFRMISLNEGHDYAKTGKSLENNSNMIEWVKKI
jgi:hypothetical protein